MCYVLCAQSCPTLCDPVDCSPPGSSVHAILQARIMEWVVMPFSRGSSPTRHISMSVSHICSGILLSHKRNEIVPFAETWRDLETVIQREVSQKEKNKYHILIHTCRTQKNGTDDLFAKEARLYWSPAMAPHSSTLAWKIPWMEEPGRLQSMGLRRVGHD